MDISDPFLLLIIVSYVLVCPYTKVEESFNMQATFDLLHFGPGDLATFDHLEFPGVVPRTFIGSLVLASLSYPLHCLVQLLRMDPVVDQIATRCVLSCISWMSFLHFKDGVTRKFGRRTAQLTLLLTCLQFHTCFYMSRTLPNVFAMILSLNAFAVWLKGGPLLSLVLLTATTVVFRCDMLVFLAPYVLQLLVCREVTFKQTAACGLLTGAMSLLLTVAIDSYFWRQWVWPEGVVLFFNTVQNKSSEWGTMPFHWYFSNALLKIFNVSLLWVACGLLGVSFPSKSLAEDASTVTVWGRLNFIGSDMFLRGLDYRSLYYAMPALHFITLYSLLPHKELRFILPAVPLLTMTGAVGLDRMLPMDCSRLWYPFNLLQTLHRRVGSGGKRRDNNDNDSHAYGAYNHAIRLVYIQPCTTRCDYGMSRLQLRVVEYLLGDGPRLQHTAVRVPSQLSRRPGHGTITGPAPTRTPRRTRGPTAVVSELPPDVRAHRRIGSHDWDHEVHYSITIV